ncbi:MAG: hypothetical protein N2440_00095 [Actinobacteria bacterium]|nr:hypothetical protein [Actinomycetota bacterium]
MKSTRINAAIIVAIMVTLLLSGCGGNAPTAEQISQTALQPSGSTTQSATTQNAPLRTPLKLPVMLKVDKSTPQFIVEALQQKKPILIFIFKENHQISLIVRENLKKLMQTPYASNLIFIALNIDKPEHVSGLVDSLGVTSVPFLALIDEKGQIVKEYSGYVDEKTIIQAVYNVTGGALQESTETVNDQGSE